MTSLTAITVFSVLCGVAGIGAFVWAMRHRQLGLTDEEAYATLEDRSDPRLEPRTATSPWRRRLFLLVLLALFLFMGWSIVVTLVASSHTPASAPVPAHGADIPM